MDMLLSHASRCQREGRKFESHFPIQYHVVTIILMNTNILILQHISVEDPGYIKDLMIKDKFNLKTIKLYDG